MPRTPRFAEIPLPPQAHGIHCLHFLEEHFPGLSPAEVQRLFKQRKVRVNGVPAGPELELNPGDVIQLPPEFARAASRRAPPIPLDVRYETAALAVLNKPAGLVMEPGPGHRHGTLREAVLAHYGAPQRALGPQRDHGLVHRLDRDTSGVLLIARTAAAYDALVAQFAARQVQKHYLALVSGTLPVGQRLILRDPLVRTRAKSGTRVRTASRGAQAETLVRPLELFLGGRYTLVEAMPRTGRTHQIRVHLARQGAPVLGDPEYGDPMANAQAQRLWGLKRIFLHAQRIQFVDPGSRHPIEVEAELPRDLAEVIHTLEARSREG